MKTIGVLGLVASVFASASAQIEENNIATHHIIPTAATQEEAFNLKHYIAHNVIGISEEEEQNMSLAEMAKRYNKIKKFIPTEEAFKLPPIHVTIGEEEALKLPKIGITIGEEEALNLKKFIKEKVIGVSEEEAAFNLKHYIAHNVIGITEEENMSLAEMAKRYNKVKKFIPAEEENMSLAEMAKRYNKVKKFIPAEEENMSLAEMAKRYNKVKKFIPAEEEEDLKLPKIGITIGEEEALKLPKIGITIGEEEALNLKKFIKEKVIGVSEEEAAFNLKHYIAHNVIGITEEENMSLAEMAKRYNKVKKFIPAEEEEAFKLPKIGITIGEEEALNLKHYIAHNVIGISEEELNMSLAEMAKRYNKVKKFIPAEEENMSLAEMAKRYNKVKKFIPVAEEEAFIEIAQNGISEQKEEQNMSLKEMFKRYNKVKKFIPPVV